MSQQFVEEGLRPAWSTVRIGWHVRDADSVVLIARATACWPVSPIMRYADEAAHLNLLAVVPEHRRHGMARALLGWLEESARTAGAFDIGLELRAGNAARAPSTRRSATGSSARSPATTRAWKRRSA